MRIQYNGKSKILIRLAELVNQKADAEDLEQTAADLQKEIDEKADKSAIPTVGDGVLSVQRNGKSVGTFSANAAKDTAINIPIPKKVSELENDAGYGTYTKLSTGIPKSDLASGVQASLGKADTALQKHQDISGKQDKLTAGANITISGNTISAKDTTYGNASASAAGLMSAADKKKLDGMGLSKYLPLAGGTMAGDIDMATNQKDIYIGSHKQTSDHPSAVAGGSYEVDNDATTTLKNYRSLVGTFHNTKTGNWFNMISVRHRNGYGDGGSYGMYIYSGLTYGGNLIWNKQTAANTWQGERVLLDSGNYTSYASDKNHTHSAITNCFMDLGSAGGTVKWIRLGTIVSNADGRTMVIRVWSGDGFNARTNQNSSFEIHIKDSWQSTPSATNACAVTVYRINCPSTVTVKVIPTDALTYTVWVHPSPWTYWNGNYAVYGYYKTWTRQYLIQDAEPDGTAAAIAYYDQAFLTSNVASATKLATARTLTVGNTGKSFNGAANVSWSLDEIGVLGRTTKGKTYKLNNVSYNGSATDYVFNDYSANQAGGGEYITVTGSQNIALGGNCIFLAGWRNTAQGNQCVAMGQDNIVAGTANIALGCGNQVTADAQGGLALGNLNTCKANASLSGGWYTEVQKSSNQSIGYGNHVTVATASCAAFGAYNSYNYTGPYLILGNGTSSARANAFRAAAAGVYSSGSYHSSGADYAEYFEWLDGNLNNEDRRGRFVKLDGEKILLAESVEDDILGVVSGNPSVIGDSYEDQWRGQYMTDIYGEPLTEDYTDEDGTTRKVWVLNPDYNPDKPYVPRSDRQEWSAVGMMGKLIVIDDGTCKPNDYCVPTTGGIATRSEGRVGYRVLSRIDDTHIKVLIKG